MMNGKQYVESLARMKILVYIDGEPVREFWDHPAMRPAVNSLAATYDLASDPGLDPEVHKYIVAESPLTGGKINRFLNIVQSQEDLLARMRLQRAMMRHTGGCFGGRCVAGAVINALWSVTYELEARRQIRIPSALPELHEDVPGKRPGRLRQHHRRQGRPLEAAQRPVRPGPLHPHRRET